MADAADELDIPLADFENGKSVFFDKGIQNKKFVIAKGVLEADELISISKLKTHGFAKMTGAIKNQFGCIPGKLKGEMHVKLPGVSEFSQMLVDLNNFVKPSLYVMDGIMAMEGNGPRGGNSRQMNVLLFSKDPVALDATVCRMIDLKPELVPTTKLGMETGMGTYLESEIELVGDPLESFKSEKFDVSRKPIKAYRESGLMKALKNLMVPRPYIIEDMCVKCGVCTLMCPVNPKAVDWKENDKSIPPVYDYSKCIRCYCCQELCPESAIKLKTPIARKLINPLMK
jgi:Pyruvate/2-oxoacid:ferredoxin oxidoreductase delta subunit